LDGARLALSWADILVIWNTETSEIEKTIQVFPACDIDRVFSPNWNRMAAVNYSAVYVWDIEKALSARDEQDFNPGFCFDGEELKVQLGKRLPGHASDVWSVAISAVGNRLASGSADGTVRIWDIEAEDHGRDRSANFRYESFRTIWSPEDLRLACWSPEELQIWSATTGELQNIFRAEKSSIVCAASFSPDGQRIALGYFGEAIRIWNSTTGELQHTFTDNTGGVFKLRFSPDGKFLASCGNQAVLWDAQTGNQVKIFELQKAVLAISPDNSFLALASGQILSILDIYMGKESRHMWHSFHIKSTLFINRTQLASCSGGVICIWDTETGDMQGRLSVGSHLYNLSISHGGTKLTTDIGCIDLHGSSYSTETPKWMGYGLDPEKSWISWNGIKVLWIPWEYRPSNPAVGDHVVVLKGSDSPMFIGFKPNVSPIKEITVELLD
jgi:WD40 repeat protein